MRLGLRLDGCRLLRNCHALVIPESAPGSTPFAGSVGRPDDGLPTATGGSRPSGLPDPWCVEGREGSGPHVLFGRRR